MKKNLCYLLLALVPLVGVSAENKAISIPLFAYDVASDVSGYRVEISESILGDRSGGATDRSGKSFTLAAWVNLASYTNASPNYGSIVLGHGARAHMNYNGSLALKVDQNGYLGSVAGAGNGANTLLNGENGTLNVQIPLATWVYLAVVYNNDTQQVSIYKDGEYVSLQNNGKQLELFGDNPTIFFIGGAGFAGLCDDFEFYDKALTTDEVLAVMNNPQSNDALKAWYTFDEVIEGTTGQFANMATGGTDVKAVLYNLTGAYGIHANSDGGYVSITNFNETAPTLVEGRMLDTTPTLNVTKPAENDVRIVGIQGALHIEAAQATASIYTANGALLRAPFEVEGNATIEMPAGLYIVRIGEKAQLVNVK